jgi:hypothetical protein
LTDNTEEQLADFDPPRASRAFVARLPRQLNVWAMLPTPQETAGVPVRSVLSNGVVVTVYLPF